MGDRNEHLYCVTISNLISVCGPGKYRHNSTSECMSCPYGTFKADTGNMIEMCENCTGGVVGIDVTTDRPNATQPSHCGKYLDPTIQFFSGGSGGGWPA